MIYSVTFSAVKYLSLWLAVHKWSNWDQLFRKTRRVNLFTFLWITGDGPALIDCFVSRPTFMLSSEDCKMKTNDCKYLLIHRIQYTEPPWEFLRVTATMRPAQSLEWNRAMEHMQHSFVHPHLSSKHPKTYGDKRVFPRCPEKAPSTSYGRNTGSTHAVTW